MTCAPAEVSVAAWAKSLTGQKFNRLTALYPCGRTAGGNILWFCKCDCGGTSQTASYDLKAGIRKSCGCLPEDKFIGSRLRHGACVGNTCTPEFKSWSGAISRCENPHNSRYHRYGGRGIKVSSEWRVSFEKFLADMGLKPTPSASLDRIDNDGPYSAANCRWATPKQQSDNRSHVIPIKRSDGRLFASASEAGRAMAASRTSIINACIKGRQFRGYGWQAVVKADIEAARKPGVTR